jgi:hypothetical protein
MRPWSGPGGCRCSGCRPRPRTIPTTPPPRRRGPRQDPQASWQRFVETQVEVAPEAAVDAQTFLMTYFRWCPSHGELALAEARVLAALQAQGVEVRTGARSGAVTVVGVRLVG